MELKGSVVTSIKLSVNKHNFTSHRRAIFIIKWDIFVPSPCIIKFTEMQIKCDGKKMNEWMFTEVLVAKE